MKVISYKNLPTRWPVVATIAWWLLLDRLDAPGWLWGTLGTLLVIAWVACIYNICVQEQVNVVDK